MPRSIPMFAARVFRRAKDGSSEAECEDVARTMLARGLCAVADGASDSSFAREWADLLVEQFLEDPVLETSQWREWLPPLQQRWRAHVDALELPWFARDKAELGAYATLLGLVFRVEWTWEAVAVGDSCLFHVRDGRLLRGFPVERSTDFGVYPPLVGARLPADDLVRGDKERRARGTFRTGDAFYLMTDALAQWFLSAWEDTRVAPCQATPLAAASDDEFAASIAALRGQGRLRNDDVALVRVHIGERRSA